MCVCVCVCVSHTQVLRQKTATLEDVDEQRKYIDSLPNKILELMQELEAAKVRGVVCVCVYTCV